MLYMGLNGGLNLIQENRYEHPLWNRRWVYLPPSPAWDSGLAKSVAGANR
jgi:hypothetical protein